MLTEVGARWSRASESTSRFLGVLIRSVAPTRVTDEVRDRIGAVDLRPQPLGRLALVGSRQAIWRSIHAYAFA